VVSAGLGILAGFLFALGWAFLAGLTAAFSQILDGVDGQLARLTGKESRAGAFMDSVVDRYADGALVIGLVVYLARFPFFSSLWELLVLGAFALIGSSLISYTSARAESLGIDLGKPTLASKGTRVTVIALSGLLSPLCHSIPVIATFYLALHSNLVVVRRLIRTLRQAGVQGRGDTETGRSGDVQKR